MQNLIHLLRLQSPCGIVYDTQLVPYFGEDANRRHQWVKRALAKKTLLPLRRGLYVLSPDVRGQPIDPLVLAQPIYGPSYISLESALSLHGLIPEAVRAVTSVCYGRSKQVATPFGLFSYSHIPQLNFFAGVEARKAETGSYLLAKPLKALADYVYVSKKAWRSLGDAAADLRLDEQIIQSWTAADVESLLFVYSGDRVRRFLKSVLKGVRHEY
jgi:hypothetical protein